MDSGCPVCHLTHSVGALKEIQDTDASHWTTFHFDDEIFDVAAEYTDR